MACKLPKKDVGIIGLGWTGSILANELTDEGLEVVAIERGPGATRQPIFRRLSTRMNCVMAFATSFSCGPRSLLSPFATR
jgi:choline dehydrogenase-like flavoprotein